MLLNKEGLSGLLTSVSQLWLQNVDALGEIDSQFGDGDHGVTIGKIAGLVTTSLGEWSDAGIKGYLDKLSVSIMAVNGGSAGPLYGTLFEGLASPLAPETDVVDAPLLKRMIAASRDAMLELSKARVGDKTMMDALIPAAEAAERETGDIVAVLRAAALAARNGAEATKNMVSKFGRARSYGEKTLGSPDAGAVSTALLFEGLSAGAEAATESE